MSQIIFITLFIATSGCPWPKATVKSPVGACNLRPLFFIFSYFLFFIFYCLALALPCFDFIFCCQGTERGSYTGNGQCFFFPFAARDRMRKLHREWVLKARPYVHVVGSV